MQAASGSGSSLPKGPLKGVLKSSKPSEAKGPTTPKLSQAKVPAKRPTGVREEPSERSHNGSPNAGPEVATPAGILKNPLGGGLKCPECPKLFMFPSNLNLHLRQQHPGLQAANDDLPPDSHTSGLTQAPGSKSTSSFTPADSPAADAGSWLRGCRSQPNISDSSWQVGAHAAL